MSQAILYTPAILGLADYNPYSKRRRLLDHVRDILTDYTAYLPLTVRQIYYRLVATHAEYPKTQKFYKEQVVDTLARARRAGLIDWDAIRDDGVTTNYCGTGYSGLEAFKRSISQDAGSYSRNKHQNQPRQIFVLCEAAGMVPQLTEACGEYPVTVQSSGGMDSLTAKYRLAEECAYGDTVILHVGDFDPTGLSIYHQIALDVRQMAADLCTRQNRHRPMFECKRIAVLPDHVNRFGLLTGTAKSDDDAKVWYPGLNGDRTATCEAEALPPDILVQIVRQAVETEVDHDAFQELLALEVSERARAVEAVSGLRFDGGAK